ncbi:polyprenyl synthetase family protein [soil metagenome]
MTATLTPSFPGTMMMRATPLPFAPILSDLEESEKVLTAALAKYRSPMAPLVEHLKHYRGKRLRPALLLLTAKACGGITPAHHRLAAAVEMIHTATLVHDDVLDDAELRRHVTTVNAKWDNTTAILLGDMLFTHSFHLTSTVDGRACQIIGEATNRVCAGELRQVCEKGNLHLSEADYYAIVDGKTAALTECCGRLGALYAGAGEAVADKLADYGRNLGIAFQIADDLLDFTGQEEKTGKTLGTDLAQLKLTLPLIHALATLPKPEANRLREALKDPNERRHAVQTAFESTGSVTFAKKKAEEFARKAKQCLEVLAPSECKTILEHLTDWSIRREK